MVILLDARFAWMQPLSKAIGLAEMTVSTARETEEQPLYWDYGTEQETHSARSVVSLAVLRVMVGW